MSSNASIHVEITIIIISIIQNYNRMVGNVWEHLQYQHTQLWKHELQRMHASFVVAACLCCLCLNATPQCDREITILGKSHVPQTNQS